MAAQIKIASSTDATISIFTSDEAGQRKLVTTISIEAGNEASLSVADGMTISFEVNSTAATPPPTPTATATATPVSGTSKTGIRSTATVTGS